MSVNETSPEAISQQFVGFFMRVMKQSQAPLFELARKYDLTLSQLKLLMILGNSERPMALHELADATHLSLPAAGRAVDSLVKHKMVDRREDELDRRVKRVALTAKGTEQTERIADARVAAVQAVVEQLDQNERAALADALAPLLESLPALDDCAADSPIPMKKETEAAR